MAGLHSRKPFRVRYALAAAALVALAGCGGGSSSVSAEDYAASLCTSVGVWKEKLVDGSLVLSERLNAAESAADAKVELIRFYDGVIRETDVMLAEVEALEPPDVDSGAEAHQAVVEALDAFQPILAETRTKAQKLPVDDEAAFAIGAQSLGADYASASARVGSTVGTAVASSGAPEVEAAVSDSPACQSL